MTQNLQGRRAWRFGHDLIIQGGSRARILLPAWTSIDLPVGYMDQPTGLLHIYLWRRLCGRSAEEVFLRRLSE